MKVWTRVEKRVFDVELCHLYHMEGGDVCLPPVYVKSENFTPEKAAEIVHIIVINFVLCILLQLLVYSLMILIAPLYLVRTGYKKQLMSIKWK